MASFSWARSSFFSNSSSGIGGWRRPGEGRGGAVAARGALSGRLEEVEDRALADLGVLLDLLAGALGLLEHREHALARRAGRAEGPALDQRLDRALVDGAGSTRSQKSQIDRNSPPSSRARLIASTAA